MTTRARAEKIVEQLQPILEKFHLEAHIILSEEDEAASDDEEEDAPITPLTPPKKRPRRQVSSEYPCRAKGD